MGDEDRMEGAVVGDHTEAAYIFPGSSFLSGSFSRVFRAGADFSDKCAQRHPDGF
ncbi:MAG: hypothetical protein RL735_1175 [Pseudomonadota bacterium]|jgi:hypothetical protein